MTEPILEIKNLKKNFVNGGYIDGLLNNRTVVNAVENVNLQLYPDETVALIGESGCGKSTVAKTIMGLHSPTTGEILFDGEPLTKKNVGQKPIQIIFQDPAESLNNRKTIGNIISAPLKFRDVTNPDEKVDDLLRKVGLSPQIKNRYPAEFSGGQKQRIAIARSLASNPKVLIADEPVSGLDVSVQSKIINLLNDLQQEMDLSLLIISHNLSVVRTIADKVNIMYLGEIVERGPAKTVFENPVHPYTEALLSAVYIPDPDSQNERIILSGELPNPENPPAGCRFHTRCPYAIDGVCKNEHPELTNKSTNEDRMITSPEHEAMCHLLDESKIDEEDKKTQTS